jgi:hypothetical protein
LKKSFKKPLFIFVLIILVVAIALAVFFSSQGSYWLDKDNVFFYKSNPYSFSVGVNDETGFEKMEIKINSYSASSREYHCYYTDPTMVSYMASRFGGFSGGRLEDVCEAFGYAHNFMSDSPINGGCPSCFRDVGFVPAWIRFKHGSDILWESRGTPSLPVTIDIAPYLTEDCKASFLHFQSNERGENSELNKCTSYFTFESSDSAGSMGVSFGKVVGSIFTVATCFDGIKNQDETNIDYGGVCGNDYCKLKSITCELNCTGTTYSTGSCEPSTGKCIWTAHENSTMCGYVEPEAPTETLIPITENITEPSIIENIMDVIAPSENITEETTSTEQPTTCTEDSCKFEPKRNFTYIYVASVVIFLITIGAIVYIFTRKKRK